MLLVPNESNYDIRSVEANVRQQISFLMQFIRAVINFFHAGSNNKVKPKKLRSSASSREQGSKSAGKSSLVQRVLSANRHKVSKLHNIVEDLEREVSDLKGENKTLKRIQHRQEKEIKRIDVEEGNLPLILERHSAEVRNLRERLKRTQEILTKKEREAKDQDDAVFKLRDNLKRYKELAANKNLGERDSLAKRLDSLELSLAERDRRILVRLSCS